MFDSPLLKEIMQSINVVPRTSFHPKQKPYWERSVNTGHRVGARDIKKKVSVGEPVNLNSFQTAGYMSEEIDLISKILLRELHIKKMHHETEERDPKLTSALGLKCHVPNGKLL